jgi:hypothetical protein
MILSIDAREISLIGSFFSCGNVTRAPESGGDRLTCGNAGHEIISDFVFVLFRTIASHIVQTMLLA